MMGQFLLFRKKTPPVEAARFPSGGMQQMAFVEWIKEQGADARILTIDIKDRPSGGYPVEALELEWSRFLLRETPVLIGDWVIKAHDGRFYSCRADVFAKSYELVCEQATGLDVNDEALGWMDEVWGASFDAEIANHVLFHFSRGGYEGGSFVTSLLNTMARADFTNLCKLRSAFPEYLAAIDAFNTPGGAGFLQRIAEGDTP